MKLEDDKVDDFELAMSERATHKKKVANVSHEVAHENELVAASGKDTKRPRVKAHRYGLTPGKSPFPNHVEPTVDACEEVNRLLSELHGEVVRPTVTTDPSLEVTGCGEVRDALDAIIRTYLSSNTSATNSNKALNGLVQTFGLRTSGSGRGSINYEAMLAADVKTIEKAIWSGGMAPKKSKTIKKILEIVHVDNIARRDAFVKERETGKDADIPGAKDETNEAKDMEILKFDENLLSMDHIFEMSNDEAMEELIKLPGIAVKTASCVILFNVKRPSFAVDTHVLRHCKMLSWVPPEATANKTFSHCEVRVPDHLKYSLHQLFIKHGRTCARCAAKASQQAYKSTICPIEHLIDRSLVVSKEGSSKKRKRREDDVEESDED